MSAFLAVAKVVHGRVQKRRAARGPLRPTWTDEFETLATVFRSYGRVSHLLPVSVQRRATELRPIDSEVVRTTRIERVNAGGVPAAWFTREDSDRSRVLVYLHGGGYALGSLGSHRDLISRFCADTGMSVLAIEYRRAPEHRFPAQLEDSVAAYHWLLSTGVDPKRVAIAGESAGGGLTASTLLRLRDDAASLPAAAVCISPWFDLEATGESMRTNDRFDYVSRRTILWFARQFVRPGDERHPLAAPLHADLSGLPPLLVQVGAAETLLDDSTRFADRASRAGVDVTLEVADDMIHAWHIFAPRFELSRQAIARAAAFIRERTAV